MRMNQKNFKYVDYQNRQYDLYAFAKYAILLSYLNKFRDERLKVLNVGCGSGEMNYLLALNQNWVIHGIDPDSKAIKLSLQIVKKHHLSNIQILNQSLEDFYRSYSQGYDIIMANDVLEHINDDSRTVQIIYQMLNKNGLFALSVPSLPFLYGYHDEILGHYRRYKKRSLDELLRTQFNIQHIRYFGFFLIPVSLMISKILRRPFPVNQRTTSNPILETLISIEKKINPPLGTSILCICIKK